MNITDMDDMKTLKAAISLLIGYVYRELLNGTQTEKQAEGKNGETSKKISAFGKAAPVVTLEALVRLLVALAQVEKGAAPPAAMIAFSDAEQALIKSLAQRVRQRSPD